MPPADDRQHLIVLTADPALADQLHRLAAAAGVDCAVHADLPLPERWLDGHLLVVGGDLARSAAAASRPRRGSLLIVTTDLDDADVWQHALALGAEQVVVLPDAQEWLVERIARTAEPAVAARTLAVVGGCGGAGASVLAAALAASASDDGHRVLLADLDPLGGGLDLLVGADDLAGLRWPDLVRARGRLPADSVHEALPRLGTMAVLAWARDEPVDVPAAAVDAVLGAAVRSHELVVLDLPRTGDAAVQRVLRGVDDLLVVVPARMRAAAAAVHVVASVAGSARSVRAVVRQGPADRLGAHAVCDVLGLPLAAQMRDEPRLDAAIARGEVPGLRSRGPLRRAAEQCLAQWAAERAA